MGYWERRSNRARTMRTTKNMHIFLKQCDAFLKERIPQNLWSRFLSSMLVRRHSLEMILKLRVKCVHFLQFGCTNYGISTEKNTFLSLSNPYLFTDYLRFSTRIYYNCRLISHSIASHHITSALLHTGNSAIAVVAFLWDTLFQFWNHSWIEASTVFE